MKPVKAIELERKKIANGHVIVTYQAGDFVYYNEYENEQAANEKQAQSVLSKSYIQKDKNGSFTHIYVHPQKNTQVLKTLLYNKDNQLTLETHYYENKKKSLVRFYSNGVLTHAWSYTEQANIKLGTYYKKNAQNKYDITHLSKPIYDKKGELSHLVMMETFPNGNPTGTITERTFYLLNKPSIRVNYIPSNTNTEQSEIIYSQENGKWIRVTDHEIAKQLQNIFKQMIILESNRTPSSSTLEKNSNITFEELYYKDVFLFKQTHSDVHVFTHQNETTPYKKPHIS
ncbi:MAG: hypothetical protein J6V53_04730 [Alphaproteobacteria bacterium]|nr:hypothetical protein [Alphaproteobacteria bacterium]